MLKTFAIFALSLFFMLSVQTHAQPQKTQEGNGSQKPTVPSSAPAQQTSSPKPQTERRERVDADVTILQVPEKDAFDIITLIVNIVLGAVGITGVGVGIFGIVYARKTLGQISIQTTRLGEHAEHFSSLATAAKENAKAASDQAKHMIASERAWVIVSCRFPDGLHPGDQDAVTRFRWEFKNVGNSPAQLLEFDGVAQRADRWNIHFPDVPHFFDRAIPLNKLLLVPNDSWGITWMVEGDPLSAEEFESLRDWGKTTLISYGYVKYLDVFGEVHTTRFCKEFWFDKESKKAYFAPKIEAPASYTECN